MKRRDDPRPHQPHVASWRTNRLRTQLELAGVRGLPAVEDSKSARVPARAHALLWRHAVASTGDDMLGARLAASAPLGRWGEVEYALMSAPDPRAMIALAALYWPLIAQGQHFDLRPHTGERVRLELTSPYRHGIASTQIYEGELVYIRRFIGLVYGAETVPREVHLRRPRPSEERAADFELLLGSPVRFGRETHALIMAREDVSRPSACHAPTLHAEVRRSLDERLRDWRASDLLARIETTILDAGCAHAEFGGVARALGMSSRTLQRRLLDRGTTWRALFDDTRRREALRLMADPARSIQDIAYALGYAEPSSFGRAFKRWTGDTPMSWRSAYITHA